MSRLAQGRKFTQIRPSVTPVDEGVDFAVDSFLQFNANNASFAAAERPKGWKLVQKSLPRIIDYGRDQGILPPLPVEVIHFSSSC